MSALDDSPRVPAAPTKAGWYPALPCCPFCSSRQFKRGEHPSGVCVSCFHRLSPARLAQLEHVPAAIAPAGYAFYLRKPEHWVASQLGSSHLRGIPHGDHVAEAHRLMHLLLARFWHGEENELSYDVLGAMHHDVWAQVGEVGDLDDFQDSEDSIQLRAKRERHNLHVRIWRNKFNNRVAKPLLVTLARLGLAAAAPSIARAPTTTPAVGWVPYLIVDAVTPGRSSTYWSFVLDHWVDDVQVVMVGSGLAYPTHVSVIARGVPGEQLEFSAATLLSLLQAVQKAPASA